MLSLIGLGLNPMKHMTLEAIDALKCSDEIYLEEYTSRFMDSGIVDIENLINKKISIISRNDVESKFLIERARKKNVSLVMPGDPMIATTHVSLILDLISENIEYRIINGISILCTVPSLTGLQSYKFGRSISIPFPEYNYYPKSVYDFLKYNRNGGLHTISFLDLKDEREMSANMGMDILLFMEKMYSENVIDENTVVAVISRAGSADQKVYAGKIKDLIDKNFGKTPHLIVISGNLHFMELEALKRLTEYIE
ncbi:MAG: diphthine synthase [Thermoplasmata archaeon]